MSESRELHRLGRGNWDAQRGSALTLERIYASAQCWREQLQDVRRPWLCWNVDPAWNFVQQKLVQSVGWTPVVGFDPRVGKPERTVDGAVVVDFNSEFGFPVLFPHFVIEFVFLFAERLAFWHSDLLIRPKKMSDLAKRFDSLPDGNMYATGQRFSLSAIRAPQKKRYWELIGCTTRLASQSQFDQGCGWWMNFQKHPNCPDEKERKRREKWYWDYGTGVRYWHERLGGPTQLIKESYVEEGHCTRIKNANYVAQSPQNEKRNLAADINYNYDLATECERLGLSHLLE